MVDRLGLTGVQFINVKNGCATGGSALFSAQMAIRSGEFELGWRWASTSIRAGVQRDARRI
jgi:acetyl-CoA acetyltransferase